ncbi:MAG: toll/interleukin-1 receptor domain-containing protein [Saprospiraceae bacterium]|nr:toll/interleukin-1 receptor domain-containing protein [Saprospiraceae bacterium]
MLRIYISHALADRPVLEKLLRWLKPLEEQYGLDVFYNTPAYAVRLPYHWDDMLDHLETAHIYLFLISYQSLSSSYIEQEEVPRAVERFIAQGDAYVRILPVLVTPSHWDKQSRLAGFKPLGDKKLALSEVDPEEQGYLSLIEQLRQVIIELQRNWLEEQHRQGQLEANNSRQDLYEAEAPEFTPIPGWASVVLVLVIFYMVTSWYFKGCAPRMYHNYVPKEMPYQPEPDRYLRDHPLRSPEDVPLRPNEDTVGQRQALPQ